MSDTFLLAATQAAPVYLDATASLSKACDLIEEAGRKGADLLAFGETWLRGIRFSHSPVQSHPMGSCRSIPVDGD